MSGPLSSPLPVSLVLLRTTFHTRVTSSSSQPVLLTRKHKATYKQCNSKTRLRNEFDPWLLLIHPIYSLISLVLPHSPMKCSVDFREQAGKGQFPRAAENTGTFFCSRETGSPKLRARELVLVCST